MFSFYKVALTKAALVKVIEDVAETRPDIIYPELQGYTLLSRTSVQPEMTGISIPRLNCARISRTGQK